MEGLKEEMMQRWTELREEEKKKSMEVGERLEEEHREGEIHMQGKR